jgi:hypothetical protein
MKLEKVTITNSDGDKTFELSGEQVNPFEIVFTLKELNPKPIHLGYDKYAVPAEQQFHLSTEGDQWVTARLIFTAMEGYRGTAGDAGSIFNLLNLFI